MKMTVYMDNLDLELSQEYIPRPQLGSCERPLESRTAAWDGVHREFPKQ